MVDDRAEPGAPAASWGVLGTLLKFALILAGLGVAAFLFLVFLLIQGQPKPPSGVVAPVAWRSSPIVLRSEAPSLVGHLTLSASSIPANGFRVGVNIGAPSVPNPSPGAALAGPGIRLTARPSSGTATSCLAPCELNVPDAFACDGGTCRMDVEVTVELLDGSADRADEVTVTVSGGITGGPKTTLATPFNVELAFEAQP